MNYLNWFDYSLIIAYFAVLIVMGLYLHRKASASLEDYFLAGKSLPWWAIGISGMTWSLDMTGTMLITSLLYLFGPRGMFIEFRGGVPLSLVFVMAWTGKWHRRSNCMTGAEWQVYRFGNGIGGKSARLLSAIAGIVFTIGMLAYLIKGAGLFLCTFLPQFSPLQCSLMMVGITTLYTVVSGFYGVVYTDIFQAVLIFIGIVIISFLAMGKVESFTALSELTQKVLGHNEWMTSFPQMHVAVAPGYEMYECLFMFTIFLLFRNIITGFGTGNTPQYFAARNERECGKIACLWSTLLTFRWPMMIGYAVLGLILVNQLFPDVNAVSQAAAVVHQAMPDVAKPQWPDMLSKIANSPAQYPEIATKMTALLGQNWNELLQYISYEGTVNAEKILPAVLMYSIPAGLKGLILVMLMAAAMSTFSSTVNMAAALFTRDIYQAFTRPQASNRELIWTTYGFTIVLVFVSFVMSYFAASINDVWGWVMMGLVSGLAIPGVLRLYWWRFNGQGFAIGTFGGLVAAVVQRLFWPDLPEQMQFVILTLVSLVLTVAGTLLTEPTDRKTLEHFYKTTRPFGIWGDLKQQFSERQQKMISREHKNDLLSLPFIFLWMVTLYLLPMQLMIMSYNAFFVTLALFVISLVGIYFFWHKPGKAYVDPTTIDTKEKQEVVGKL